MTYSLAIRVRENAVLFTCSAILLWLAVKTVQGLWWVSLALGESYARALGGLLAAWIALSVARYSSPYDAMRGRRPAAGAAATAPVAAGAGVRKDD